jgi:hypothetical protein
LSRISVLAKQPLRPGPIGRRPVLGTVPDVPHAHDRRAAPFLGYPQRSGPAGVQAGDTGLALGGEQVCHLFRLAGPAGDGGGDPEFQVVGVGGHGDGPGPVFRHRLHRPCLLPEVPHG